MKLRLVLPLALVAASLTLHAEKKPTKPVKAGEAKPAAASTAGVQGWLDWRGPLQTGVSLEKGLPEKIDSKAALWTADFPGQSAPVIANGKLYIMGYLGEGPDLQEGVACFDAETGKLIWKQLYNDFLSDVVYLRYSTSSPTVDAETGNVYTQGSQGLFSCFTADGKLLWQHSMMEEFGRLTFPNNRTASPLVDKDLVITRGITSSWGAHGPAGDRFYAFDKKTGELVWSSAPGDRPQDNTFCHPWLGFHEGKRVLYSAGGDSTLIALNARTGEPLWRVPVAKAGAKGGINASVLEYKGNIIVVHESENIDSTEIGRMTAYKIPSGVKPPTPATPQLFTPKEMEQWRNPVGSLASSPVLVGNTIYEVSGTGDLYAINADDGKVIWKEKLGIEQRQSTPIYADGKIYVAVYIAAKGGASTGEANDGGSGEFFVVKPGEKKAEILSRTIVEGKCFGSPVAYHGKVYLQTDKRLYCFGKKGDNKGLATYPEPEKWPTPGEKAQLQVVPYETVLKPGQSIVHGVRVLDANGFRVDEPVDLKAVKWETFIPPTALVKATMNTTWDAEGKMVASPEPKPSAGAFKATLGTMVGFGKGRILPNLPIKADFETFDLKEMTGPGLGKEPVALPPAEPGKPAPQPGPTTWNVFEEPTAFSYPPLPWNSCRFRFEVRQSPGEGATKALCKTIDNKLFQRGQVFIGTPEMKNYTIEADVLTEGNKRKMSEIGLINQRYIIVLKGNFQQIEINSNQELLKANAPVPISPNTWYHLKARVDNAADDSAVVRGKAWKKGDPEPEAWSIEYTHKTAHQNGAPGFYSFTPQEQRAWIDNIVVTPNK